VVFPVVPDQSRLKGTKIEGVEDKKLYLSNQRSDFDDFFTVFPVFSNAKIAATHHRDPTTLALQKN
jgi:hypothetical protein